MMPYSEAGRIWGPQLLKDLTVNDSWIRRTYVEVARAGRELSRFPFDDASVIHHANRLQERVLSGLPVNNVHARPVSSEKVMELSDLIESAQGGLIVMRHGVQFVEDEERNQLAGAVRKIRLMQNPHNVSDPADAQSLAEAASLGIVLMYVGKKLGLQVKALTAQNRRAADIAAVISVVNRFSVKVDSRLTCANYPHDRSDDELREMLGKDGTLINEREEFDRVCGEGSFDATNKNMRSLIEAYRKKQGIVLAITHTPQTSAADVIASETPVRMPELGFRVFAGDVSKRFLGNVFLEPARDDMV